MRKQLPSLRVFHFFMTGFSLALAIQFCGAKVVAQEGFEVRPQERVINHYGDTDEIVTSVVAFTFDRNKKYKVTIEAPKKTVILISKQSTDGPTANWPRYVWKTYPDTKEFTIDPRDLTPPTVLITVWGDPEAWTKPFSTPSPVPLRSSNKSQGAKPTYTFEYELYGNVVKLVVSRL